MFSLILNSTILLLFIGAVFIIVGMFLKRKKLVYTGLMFFSLLPFFTFIATYNFTTQFPSPDAIFIDAANFINSIALVLSIISFVTLLLRYKKHKAAKSMTGLVVVIAILALLQLSYMAVADDVQVEKIGTITP